MSAIKILYVEDELNLANIVRDTLTSSGYDVKLVSDGAFVLNAALDYRPDICLLDVMLPHTDGFTLGRELAKRTPKLPIIFLTAKSQSQDVVTGFKSGGNDYIKKPFSMEELMVRIDNLLALKGSTPSRNTTEAVAIGRFQFNPLRQTLTIGESVRKLSYREVEVLTYCAARLNGQVDKKTLLLEIWGDDNYYNARNLDVYIRKLRSYLSDDPQISILTLRGVGYKFVVESSLKRKE